MSHDPLTDEFPWWTPYQFAGCEPIANSDLDGAEKQNETVVLGAGETVKDIAHDMLPGGERVVLRYNLPEVRVHPTQTAAPARSLGYYAGFLANRYAERLLNDRARMQDRPVVSLLNAIQDVGLHATEDIKNDRVRGFASEIMGSANPYRFTDFVDANTDWLQEANNLYFGPVTHGEFGREQYDLVMRHPSVQIAKQRADQLTKAFQGDGEAQGQIAGFAAMFFVTGIEGGAGSSKVLLNSSKQLQTKFKHAVDFGVQGNYNTVNAGKFSAALNKHINSVDVIMIQGKYRGQPAIHYLNRNTRVNVISTRSGHFVSGWKLNPSQLQSVLQDGFLW
jgi:Colicin D